MWRLPFGVNSTPALAPIRLRLASIRFIILHGQNGLPIGSALLA